MPALTSRTPQSPTSGSPFHDRVIPLPTGARPVPLASVQGTLALELQPRHDPPTLPRMADDSAAGRGAPGLGDVVPIDRRVRLKLEDWSRRYAQAAVEIVGGDRPVTQLLRWSSSAVYEDLSRRALLVARAGAHQPGAGRVQPVRPKVVGARTCFVTADIVEAGIHVRYGGRSRAVAARFELRRDRWVCTALEFA